VRSALARRLKLEHLRHGYESGVRRAKARELTLKADFFICGIKLAVPPAMTKKRFKFSLMALGALAAFFLALIVLFLAPASADRSSAKDHHKRGDNFQAFGGAPDPIYFEHWNGSGGGHTSGGGSCVGASCGGDKPDGKNFDGDNAAGDSGQPGSDNGSDNGSGNGSGNGSDQNPQGNGFGPTFFAGGSSGGGNGGSSGGDNGGSSGGGNGGSSGQPDASGPDNPDSGNKGPDDKGPNVSDPQIQNPDAPPPDLGPLPFERPPTCDCVPASGIPGGPPGFPEGPLKIPEPLTMSLFAVGLAGCAGMRRRRKGR